MKRDYCVFNMSFVLRAVGMGLFTAIFNIYVLSTNNFSEAFLEKFLSIGNLSMAIFSYFIGALIDKFSKKKLMITFTVLCSICMLLEITLTSELWMYVVSVFYGIGAIGIFTLMPPVLMTYENENRKNLIISNRAINIISITLGSIMAGMLTGKKCGIAIEKVLVLAPIFYLISATIYLFHSDNNDIKKQDDDNVRNQKKHLAVSFLVVMIVVFILLGYAPMLVNYINVYFKSRFMIDTSEIAYVYAIINLLSGLFIIFLSRINYKNLKNMVILLAGIVVVNVLLMVETNLVVQVICVFLYISLFELLTSCIYEYILSKVKAEYHGRISGILQASCNLSETLGIYVCGWLLGQRIYAAVFGFGIISTVIGALVVIIFFKGKSVEYDWIK